MRKAHDRPESHGNRIGIYMYIYTLGHRGTMDDLSASGVWYIARPTKARKAGNGA